MNALLLAAFVIAFGNTAYHLGAGDTTGAIISGIVTAVVVLTGIASSRDR